MCEYCNELDTFGNYDPCCNHGDGTCEALYTKQSISMCIHCGAEMHLDESNCWRHHSQMDLPLKERSMVHSMQSSIT